MPRQALSIQADSALIGASSDGAASLTGAESAWALGGSNMDTDVKVAWLATIIALDEGPGLEPIWKGRLDTFATDNGLSVDETIAIARDLRDGGEHFGGGGAQPEYRLTVAS
jgi:hypothetical protein